MSLFKEQFLCRFKWTHQTFLEKSHKWHGSVTGTVTQYILCDQITNYITLSSKLKFINQAFQGYGLHVLRVFVQRGKCFSIQSKEDG